MSSDIPLHMPGKVERFGIRTHGLVKCPITKLPDDTEVCYLRDCTLTTRSGKTIAMPYSIAELDAYIPTKTCPRPWLYMHPLAQMEVESESGCDWSGYVVFYQPGAVKGYLSKFRCAFTPDDNSQAILFSNDIDYVPLIMIGALATNTKTRINGVTQQMVQGPLLHVSIDGRFRASGLLGRFSDTDLEMPNSGGYRRVITAYALSGKFAEGVSAEGSVITQPEYSLTKISTNDVPGSEKASLKLQISRFDRDCVSYGKQSTATTFSTYDTTTRNRHRFGEMKQAVDAHFSSDKKASYLYLSASTSTLRHGIPRKITTSESVDFGNECRDMYGPFYGNTAEVSYLATETEYEAADIDIDFELLGWSASSSIGFEFKRLGETVVTWSSSTPSAMIKAGKAYSSNTSSRLTFEGVVLHAESSTGSRFDVPLVDEWWRGNSFNIPTDFKVMEGADTWPASLNSSTSKWFDDSSPFPFISVKFGMLSLGEGIQALFVFVTKGIALPNSTGFDDVESASIDQKLFLGRIFGFGTSRAGMEIPKTMWDKKLYAAYDPVSKTISDIYDHPIFYQ